MNRLNKFLVFVTGVIILTCLFDLRIYEGFFDKLKPNKQGESENNQSKTLERCPKECLDISGAVTDPSKCDKLTPECIKALPDYLKRNIENYKKYIIENNPELKKLKEALDMVDNSNDIKKVKNGLLKYIETTGNIITNKPAYEKLSTENEQFEYFANHPLAKCMFTFKNEKQEYDAIYNSWICAEDT